MSDHESERLIIERIVAGDRESFAILVDKYSRPVFNLVYNLTGSYKEADDLAQETFLKAYASLGKFDPNRRFFPWLYTIALNVIRNFLKKQRRIHADRIVELDEMRFKSDAPDPETRAARREEMEMLHRAVGRLPLSYREAVVLRFISGLSFEELAEILGITQSGAKMRVYRGLEKVRVILEEEKGLED